MTAGVAAGSPLARAAARGPRPAALHDDLLEMALRVLAHANDARATARLRSIERGALRPAVSGRDLRSAAGSALDLLETLDGRSSPDRSPGARIDGADPTPDQAEDRSGAEAGARVGRSLVRRRRRRHPCQRRPVPPHLRQPSRRHHPMTGRLARRDPGQCVARMGRTDFAGDVACCAGFARSGDAKSFGAAGRRARHHRQQHRARSACSTTPPPGSKWLRVINYCGGSGTNIIGCAWIGGRGHGAGAVRRRVQRGSPVGARVRSQRRARPHAGTAATSCTSVCAGRATASAAGRVRLLPHAELRRPGVAGRTPGRAPTPTSTRCRIRSTTAPDVSNNDQTDVDADGVGDACENGCGNGILDSGEECDRRASRSGEASWLQRRAYRWWNARRGRLTECRDRTPTGTPTPSRRRRAPPDPTPTARRPRTPTSTATPTRRDRTRRPRRRLQPAADLDRRPPTPT